MNYQSSRNPFGDIPQVTKHLLIINLIFFVSGLLLSSSGFLDRYLALHFIYSPYFMPHQIITYMFMHGGFTHIFFNMFALFMFGRNIEMYWGPKRFLSFYLITGIGAAVLQLLIAYFRYQSLIAQIEPSQLNDVLHMIKTQGPILISESKNYVDPILGGLNEVVNIPMVGASGAIFGILAAFGMMFPNIELMMIPIPVPVKAKYFVIGYGVLELGMGLADRVGDNVAHFAHLGGLLTGLVLLLYWKKKGTLYGTNFRQN